MEYQPGGELASEYGKTGPDSRRDAMQLSYFSFCGV